jgi:hypothetical protein
MEQVEVEILGMVITQRYGVLKSGDILRTDADFAKHLVNEASAAKYVDAVKPSSEPEETKPKRKKAEA